MVLALTTVFTVGGVACATGRRPATDLRAVAARGDRAGPIAETSTRALRATAPHPADVPTLSARADLVLIGRVTEIRSEWTASPRTIVTRVQIVVDHVLKGAPPGASLTVTQPGGQVNDVRAVVADAAVFTPGERVLLFLTRQRDGTLRPLWLWQGTFVIDSSAGTEEAIRTAPGTSVVVDRLPLEWVRERIVESSAPAGRPGSGRAP